MRHNKKRGKRGDDDWVIDTGEDIAPRRVSPRFRNLAVRRLGYTQTEAGRRTLCQIADELADLADLEKEWAETQEDTSWMNDGEGED